MSDQSKEELSNLLKENCRPGVSRPVKQHSSDESKQALEAFISQPRTSNDPQLNDNIQRAKNLHRLYSKLEKVKLSLLAELKASISEIRSYAKPAQSVQKVKEATYILLGEDPHRLKNWDVIHRLLERPDERSLEHRIVNLDISSVTTDRANRADHLIRDPVFDQAVGSRAAAHLHDWLKIVIKEVKEKNAAKAQPHTS